jgi:MscS family membrane protein
MKCMSKSLVDAICTVQLADPLSLFIVLLILVGSATVLGGVAYVVLKLLERRLSATRHYWSTTLFAAARLPIIVCVAILTLLGMIAIGEAAYQSQTLVRYLIKAGQVTFILCGGWLLLRWKARMSSVLLVRQESYSIESRSRSEFFSKMAALLIWIVVILLLLGVLGFDVTALIAFGGVGGIVVGFAARDTFANLFSGIMLYFTRPFRVGDWIDSPDRQLEGYVEEIGWYMTSLRSMDKRPIYVPNSLLTSIVIRNPARMSHRQFKFILGLRYEDYPRLPALIEALRNHLRSRQDIDQEAPVRVHLVAYGPSAIEIQVQAHSATTDWDGFYEIQHNLLMDLGKIIEEQGAELAYPTQMVRVEMVKDKS